MGVTKSNGKTYEYRLYQDLLQEIRFQVMVTNYDQIISLHD